MARSWAAVPETIPSAAIASAKAVSTVPPSATVVPARSMQATEIDSAPLTPGTCVAGVSAVGRRGLGPQVQLGAVLLEAAPDGEATEGDNGKDQQLLHGG